MESTQQSDRDTYRAIVFGQGGNELLLAPSGDGFVLPSVEIPRWQRVAENMTVAIRNEWGQEAICLFNPALSAPCTPGNDHYYQVMECCGPVGPHPAAEWIPVSSLPERTFVDSSDQVVVLESLAACDRRGSAAVSGPFARLGWFRELRQWIEEVIGPLGFHLTEGFAQLNASPSFSLFRFGTNGPAVWFKAVGEPNLREFPITVAIARLLPRYLPAILALRPQWNGWLALEAEGIHLSDTQHARDWKAAASALAKLQIETRDKARVFIGSGARDLRVSTLLKLVRPFLDTMRQLMEKQTKVPPPALSSDELMLLGEQIEEALSLSTDLGINDALGHLDLNPGNVIVSEGQCVFLDWAEAYVGNPFFSLQYLVEHFLRATRMRTTAESVLTTAYTEEWKSLVPPECLQEALALAPLLAVFAYAATNDAWREEAGLQSPKFAGYLRGLTRRMHREASRLMHRSVLCQK
jgi:hypothetical protein